MTASIPQSLRPAGDFVLLKRLAPEVRSKGGVILSPQGLDAAKETGVSRAVVIAVGPGKWNDTGDARLSMSVKPGDVVVIPPVFSGLEKKKPVGSVLEDGQLMMREFQILAVEES